MSWTSWAPTAKRKRFYAVDAGFAMISLSPLAKTRQLSSQQYTLAAGQICLKSVWTKLLGIFSWVPRTLQKPISAFGRDDYNNIVWTSVHSKVLMPHPIPMNWSEYVSKIWVLFFYQDGAGAAASMFSLVCAWLSIAARTLWCDSWAHWKN